MIIENNLRRLTKQRHKLMEKIHAFHDEQAEVPEHVELEMREVKEGIKVREAQHSEIEAQLSLI